MVKAKLADVLLKITPQNLKNIYEYSIAYKHSYKLEYANLSYSQEGEDLVLQRFLGNKKDGFFVDVGAHHPRRFSNTYLFYKQGWRGINIDPNPDAIQLFLEERPLDINCNVGVANTETTLTYYMFNEPALNTFDKKLADEYLQDIKCKLEKTLELKTRKLCNILDEFMPKDKQIDFLSVDVEGLDVEVLKSNNWEKYKPEIILIEYLNFEMKSFLESELFRFMDVRNYVFIAKTFNTVFFKRKD